MNNNIEFEIVAEIKTNKIELFKELSNFDPNTGISRFVNVAEFAGKYAELRFGNGGGWSRLDGDFGRKHKVCVVKTNGKKRFSWNTDENEENSIDFELCNFKL